MIRRNAMFAAAGKGTGLGRTRRAAGGAHRMIPTIPVLSALSVFSTCPGNRAGVPRCGRWAERNRYFPGRSRFVLQRIASLKFGSSRNSMGQSGVIRKAGLKNLAQANGKTGQGVKQPLAAITDWERIGVCYGTREIPGWIWERKEMKKTEGNLITQKQEVMPFRWGLLRTINTFIRRKEYIPTPAQSRPWSAIQIFVISLTPPGFILPQIGIFFPD